MTLEGGTETLFRDFMTVQRHDSAPAAFITKWLPRIPRGRALDVAMGEGRHALLLAAEGFEVVGVDRDARAIERVRTVAHTRGLSVDARVVDLEDETSSILGPFYALIINVNYLQRSLLPDLKSALGPGGWILFETFTTDHPRVSRSGRPSNPDYLLRPGELRKAFEDLVIVEYEEGVFPARGDDFKSVARLAAFQPGPSGN